MSNRRLQTEIEKVLKKVDEGVLVFEQIWDKVYKAMTSSQKEKYEGDLKKEIKKLQRLRDSIKTWQGDSSIKDKTKLDAARKLIEEKMEKFKVCEKETKTKAFSKEGLALDRTDPKERAKREVGEWITDAILKLRDQCDEFEAEIEGLSGSGKKGKKGSQGSSKINDLRDHMERHQHHISMLERILRAVDNETVSCDEANDLKESMDYYIELNQEPDFYEDEGMYDALDLDAVTPGVPIPSLDGELSPAAVPPVEAKKPKTSTSPPASSPPKSARTVPDTRGRLSPTGSITQPKSPPRTLKSPPVGPIRTETEPIPLPKGVLPTTQPPPITPNSNGRQPLLSSIVKGEAIQQAAHPVLGATSLATNPTAAPQQGASSTQQALTSSPPPSIDVKPLSDVDPGLAGVPIGDLMVSSLPSESQSVAAAPSPGKPSQVDDSNLDLDSSENMNKHPFMLNMAAISALRQPVVQLATRDESNLKSKVERSEEEMSAGPSPAFPAVDGSARARSTALGLSSDELSKQLSELENTIRYMPESAENEVMMAASRPYQPRNPAQVPASFPTVPAPIFDNPAIFQQFDVDTLFFIFYYQQGTYQQYLAARELKRQSWRFHKQYLTWFQRHEEPKITTDEYEQGSYFFFDYYPKENYETGWCSRIRTDFTFEYCYLEDELQ